MSDKATDPNGWNVFSECIDPDRSDYGKAPAFEGWFDNRTDADAEANSLQRDDRVAWVEPYYGDKA